jgi:hypothetical protein
MNTDNAWRADWEVADGDDGLGLPHAVHSSGLALNFVFTELDDEGSMGWCATVPRGREARLEEVRVRLGDEAVSRLYAEARQLWEELGYTDASPTKRAV